MPDSSLCTPTTTVSAADHSNNLGNGLSNMYGKQSSFRVATSSPRMLISAKLKLQLVTLFCLFVFVIVSSGCTTNSGDVGAALIPSTPATKNPIPDSKQPDLKTVWESKSADEQQLLKILDKRVDELESYLRSCMLGDTLSPSWLAGDLRVSRMDRSKMVATYAGERIRIARWRPNEETKQESGKAAIYKAVQVNCAPWLVANDIKVHVQLFDTQFVANRVKAMLLVEIFGKPTDATGRSSSSIWESTWRISDFRDDVSLANVEIKGQEEILNYTVGGELFADCTGWVMRNFKGYPEQLGRGLDEWAQKIPGIDIRGDHGIAVADINRDGFEDIYFCQPAGLPNRLFLQNPDGSVDEASDKLGLALLDHSTGVLIVDLNNDRNQDIVISTEDSLLVFSQSNGGVFQLENEIRIGRNGGALSAADFDQDGDLDLFLCKYNPPFGQYQDLFPHPNSLSNSRDGGRNLLLRNDEVWKFTDVTSQVGLEKLNGLRSRAAAWVDYDLDGDQDLYITNEFNRDILFENNDGWFSDVSEKKNMLRVAKHRTVSVGELNGDGRPDFFVGSDVPMAGHQMVKSLSGEGQTDLAKAILSESLVWYSNKSDYVSYTFPKPMFSCQSANSSAIGDINNDGLDDLFVTNGMLTRAKTESIESLLYRNLFDYKIDPKSKDKSGRRLLLTDTFRQISDLCRDGYSFGGNQQSRCYLNIGKAGFSNFSKIAGIDTIQDARSIATVDWDHDGDLDIVTSSRNGPQLRLLMNQLKSKNGSVSLSLAGTTSNRDAIGSRVEVYLSRKSTPLVKYVTATSGYLSQSSRKVIFGLGKDTVIDRVTVYWPNGNKQQYRGIQPNRNYKIVEGRTEAAEISNDRFQLVAIEKQQPRKAPAEAGIARSVFDPPFALPILEYQASENNFYSIEPKQGTSLVLILFNDQTDSDVLLRKFANSADKLKDKKVDVLAVYVNRDSESPSEDFHLAGRAIENSEFPFAWGTAAPSTITKLQYLFGDWFYDRNINDLPMIFLVDDSNKIHVCYKGEDVPTDQVLQDVGICRGETRNSDRVEFERKGSWIARYRKPKYRRLLAVFEKLGFAEDAKRYALHAAPEVATELAHYAMELHSNGDLIESKKQFENALAADSNCVNAHIGQGRLLLDASKIEKAEARSRLRNQAAENFTEALRIDGLNTDAIIGQADAAYVRGNQDLALKQLKDYLQIEPERYEVHARVGRLHYMKSRTAGLPVDKRDEQRKQAAVYLNTAFKHRPTLPYVAGDLGALLLFNSQYGSARELLRFATKVQPSVVLFKNNLAEAEFQSKNFDRAADLMQEVLAKMPSEVRPKQMLAWLYATCPYESYRDGAKGVEMAELLYELAGERSVVTLEILAACHAENNDFENAVKYQEMAHKLADTRQGSEKYSPEQIKGLNARLGLYLRKRPYRTSDVNQIPISNPDPL